MATVKNYQDREKYIAYAKKVESEKGIPSNLLVGLLGAESAFREDIITGKKLSSAGAKGIAQFMNATAKEYGIDPLNPYESIEAAGKYLTKSYKALGNWDDALRSYNMGVQGVKNVKSGKWKISKETADYVGRVYDNAKIFGEGINLPTQTYADKEPTNNITNFEPMGQMRNFASVPDLKEEPKEAVVTETESTQKLKERAFLEDYNRLIAQPQQQVAQQEEEVIPLMQDNTEEIFNDTSQFIDEGFAQEGGKFSYRRNNQPLETVRESTQVRNNFNPTLFSTTARNLTEQELRDKKTKEYQRIANERRAAREKANKNPLNQGLNVITNPSLNTRDNWAETAIGLESQFRVSDEPNFFDDYINPANMIGEMASNLGQSSKEARDSDSVLPYFTSVGAPLAVGTLAGIGAKTTGQFVNNVANPLAGAGDLGKGLFKTAKNNNRLPEIADELIIDINGGGVNLQRNKASKTTKKPQYIESDIGNGLIEKTPNRGQKDTVKKVTLDGDGSQYVELKKVQENGEDLYYFSANMPNSQLKAGRALKHLEQYIPKGATIIEKNSLSLDSFDNILKKASKNKEFEWSNHGYIPLNNASKRNMFTNSEAIVPNSVNVKFTNVKEASKALKEFNSKINIQGVPNAKITSKFDEELGKEVYGIEVPNIGLKKLYQEGGIIDDNAGQWEHPGEITRINSPNITMKNVPYPVLGVADTGEQKMMYPNLDYTFKGANSVTEYPQLTAKEKQFLKALKNDRTRIHN